MRHKVSISRSCRLQLSRLLRITAIPENPDRASDPGQALAINFGFAAAELASA
jgi:hypothetical protein